MPGYGGGGRGFSGDSNFPHNLFAHVFVPEDREPAKILDRHQRQLRPLFSLRAIDATAKVPLNKPSGYLASVGSN